MNYKIKEVSDIVGISVRTLHYYDNMDILKPKFVTKAGYRVYTDKEIERLQQILFFKELNFTLNDIKEILDNPNFDRKKALENHKKLLMEKKHRIEKIIQCVDKTIDSIKGEINMDKKDMFEGFDDTEIETMKNQYSEEARKKYGKTKAYKESVIKTSNYDKGDWNKINEEGNEIYIAIFKNMDKGIESKEIQKYVENWRNHITKNFYNCTLEIFEGLADLYIEDERFTKNIDKFGKGLAEFLSKAMKYYCKNTK